MTDLYDLPKDILVKIISTIQEQTEERYEKIIEERNFFNDFLIKRGYRIQKCSFSGCSERFICRYFESVKTTWTCKKHFSLTSSK